MTNYQATLLFGIAFFAIAVAQEVIEARLKALADVENYRQQAEGVERALAPLAQPEPQRPPKNCWLDYEPDFPSPCVFDVFDNPSDAIDNCVYAQRVKYKTDCKYYRADVQPEPQSPGDEEPAIDLSEVADLCAWLRANSSGIYRPAARAADLLKQLTQCRTARQH